MAVGMAAALSVAGCASGGDGSGTETTAEAKASATQTDATTWKYLQSEYSKFLGMECFDESDLCLSMRNALIDSFVRDATDLPRSKARADVLDAAEGLKEDYAAYQDGQCGAPNADVFDCALPSVGMTGKYSIIVTNVDREAAAE
ncbi:hypothetical protein EGT50_16210 [Rhodococcus xishaensis]|uniref:Uncharacterized protein n=2 Tax=Rhodococcus xishaensis TaxID=2487364 RepID=A0A3S3A5U6_9NOCA|nr:hypothetical protein EGT50_16210 [Rhodococcus xishaensis]